LDTFASFAAFAGVPFQGGESPKRIAGRNLNSAREIRAGITQFRPSASRGRIVGGSRRRLLSLRNRGFPTRRTLDASHTRPMGNRRSARSRRLAGPLGLAQAALEQFPAPLPKRRKSAGLETCATGVWRVRWQLTLKFAGRRGARRAAIGGKGFSLRTHPVQLVHKLAVSKRAGMGFRACVRGHGPKD